MVTLNIMDSATIIWVVLLAASLVMSFLSLRIGSIAWFVTSFLWLGLATQVDNEWLGLTAGLMAVLCQVLFILDARQGRGRVR